MSLDINQNTGFTVDKEELESLLTLDLNNCRFAVSGKTKGDNELYRHCCYKTRQFSRIIWVESFVHGDSLRSEP